MFPFLLSFLLLAFLLSCKKFTTSEALWKKACWVSISGGCRMDGWYTVVHPALFSYKALWLQQFCNNEHCWPFSFIDGKNKLLTGKAPWECFLNPLGELHMGRGKGRIHLIEAFWFSFLSQEEMIGSEWWEARIKSPRWDLPFSQHMAVCVAEARGP